MEKITKDTTIGDAVAMHPKVAEVLLGYGLHCIGCHVNAFESLEQGAMGHGMDAEIVSKMVADVNKVLEDAKESKASGCGSPSCGCGH